ncbi:MAG: glycosyltransferase family 39 protein, partial [Chloroflexota bacterium]
KLKFGARRDAIEIPVESQQEAVKPVASLAHFPIRSLAALVLALFAQNSFEPGPGASERPWILGVVLYLCALGLLILAYRRGEWAIASQPAHETGVDPLTVRWVPLVLSLILGAVTFYFMKENTFTAFNVMLWALTIFFHLRAFWLPVPTTESLWSRAKGFFTRPFWDVRITRWTLLVLAVVALTLFFRTYRLEHIAIDMTSDHAEKLQDVYDILNGKYSIFFIRNTGREPLYVYLAALVAACYSGISFLTLKIAAVIGGLVMLPYLYLFGKEIGGKRIGLLAVLFAGIAYWPNVIERFGLRISFYPLFVAPTFYYIFRGLRRQNRNDMILAGLFLGLGLNGYMPFRIVPFVVVAGFIVYIFHARSAQERKNALLWLGLVALTSWVIFIPQARFGLEQPELFGFRALSRLSTIETPLPGPAWQLFLFNLWNALKMFNWNNGGIWVHSVSLRPALDVVSGALFLAGVVLVLIRYWRSRRWNDLFLLLLVPLLLMPSILSLAFPDENPSLNRTGGAIVPVFLIVGIALDGLLTGLGRVPASAASGEEMPDGESQAKAGPTRPVLTSVILIMLVALASIHNYDLVFRQYHQQYTGSAWNTREVGDVMRGFAQTYGSADNVWVIPYPFWMDTRLPPMWAGFPEQGDIAIWPDQLADTLTIADTKLFIFKYDDPDTLARLRELYPQGVLSLYHSSRGENLNFYTFLVPAANTIAVP